MTLPPAPQVRPAELALRAHAAHLGHHELLDQDAGNRLGDTIAAYQAPIEPEPAPKRTTRKRRGT